MTTENIVEYLAEGTEKFPDRIVRFFFNGPKLSQLELMARSRRIGASLRARGLGEGDVIGVLLPTSAELIATMFGVFQAGAAMAPLTIPLGARDVETAYKRLGHIIVDGEISTIIAHRDFAPMLEASGLDVRALTPEELLEESGSPLIEPSLDPSSVAIVQYTSGSTANPKGVVLTHRQLIAGMQTLGKTAQISESDVLCTWLPLSHDMGLISTLAAVGLGVDQHISSPATFIRRPSRWLKYLSEQRATLYLGPNFSYQYLLEATKPESLGALDLSNLRLAFNGAEPIDPTVLESFIERFAPVGFKPQAMYPVYGLAEATLAVTFPTPGTPPIIDWVDSEALANDNDVIPVEPRTRRARGVVSVGRPVQGMDVRLVSNRKGPSIHPPADEGEQRRDVLPDRVVGEIQIRGAAVMEGYLRAPDETAEAYDGSWLRTGDLGYMVEGQLFVTGRIKEMMILRGSNYYPEDVEALVRSLPGLYRQRCISFVIEVDGHERMAVMLETRLDSDKALDHLAKDVCRRVANILGIETLDVILLRPRSIRRTTSGKFQRLLMRELLKTNALGDELLATFRWADGSLDSVLPG